MIGDDVGPLGAAARRTAEDRAGLDADGDRSSRSRASRVGPALVVLLGVVLVGLHIHSYRPLSQYDEAQHVDYVLHLLDGHVPASGDLWLPATTQAVACRTIDSPWDYPPCDRPDRGVMPNYGLTTEFIQPPLYYVVPAAGLWAATHLLPGDVDPVDAMRATSALWLVLGLVLLWLLFADLGVPRLVRAGISLALIAAPAFLLAHSTVTNDAAAFAAGAAVTLATLRWSAGRLPMWAPLGLAAVALVLKVTNVAVLLLACAFVLVRAVQRSDRARQRWRSALTPRLWVFVGVSAAATFLVSLGWSAVQSSRATLDQMEIVQNLVLREDSFDPSWLVSALPSLLSPLDPSWLQASVRGGVGTAVAHVVNAGLLLLALVGAVRSRPGSVVRALAIATAGAALVFGPLMVVGNYASLQIWFDIPARYGLSLVPALAVVGGTAVRGRWAGIALLVVGAGLYLAVAVRLLG